MAKKFEEMKYALTFNNILLIPKYSEILSGAQGLKESHIHDVNITREAPHDRLVS